ncbi:MAG: SDR family oxidoreductase [Planctomycetaceae bacterium]
MMKTVFVTGSNSGLGLATVRLFASKGWRVIASMRRLDQSGVLDGIENVLVLRLDVTDGDSIAQAFRESIDRYGKIDVLVNNAGYCLLGTFETTTLEQIRQQFETNVFGLMAVTQAFLKHCRENSGCRIVNIASISADNGYPFVAAYAPSKAAVAMFSEVLNVEMHDAGVQVKAVHPGLFRTEIFDSSKLKSSGKVPAVYRPMLDRFLAMQRSWPAGEAEECARVVFRAATDNRPDRVHYYAGRDAIMLRRLKRLLGPEAAFELIKRIFTHGISRWMRWFLPKASTTVDLDSGSLI